MRKIIGFAALAALAAACASKRSPETEPTFAELERMAATALEAPPVYALPNVPERYRPSSEKFVMHNGAAVMPSGRIWVSWIGGEDSAEAYTLCAFSDDGGATWRNPAVVVDGHVADGKVPRSNIIANLWLDPDGTLHLFFCQSCWHNDGRMGVWEIACANPEDAVPRWTKPRRLSDGAALNKPIVLSDGTWLLPVERARPYGMWRGCFGAPDRNAIGTLLASSDRGATWVPRGQAEVPEGWWPENHLVEMKNGDLRMYVRSLVGIKMSESRDKGFTWSPMRKPEGIDHIVSRFQIRKLRSGNWIFIRNEGGIDSHFPFVEGRNRDGIYVYLSKDEGRTWTEPLIVDGNMSVSYPDLEEAPDGRLFISHDFERQDGAEIRLHAIREADVEAGRIVSADAFLGKIVTRATGSNFNRAHRFNRAVPVWPAGRERERNGFFGFRGDFEWKSGMPATVRIAASTYYRIWLNGEFLGCGPVRAPHGYFRVDEWPVEKLARPGRNAVAVEVSNYNEWNQSIPSRQPGFLQCEVSDGTNVLAATGRDFTWFDLPRMRNVGRFSRQRGSCEFYRVGRHSDDWRTATDLRGETPAEFPLVRLLNRGNSYPEFRCCEAKMALDTVFDFDETKPSGNPNDVASGFRFDPYALREWRKVDFDNWDEFSRATNVRTNAHDAAREAVVSLGNGVIADFGRVESGFLELEVECDAPARLYAVTDDVLWNGYPDPVDRFGHATGIAWEFIESGSYRVRAFEPWGMRFVHLFARSGKVRVRKVSLTEYVNSAPEAAEFYCSDPMLNRAFATAQRTCAMHTMDATLDCATRERNSGPNDSLYTTGAYRLLSGRFDVERLFFENFAVADGYPDVRYPLFASFYPADPPRYPAGELVNYSLWFILELERYVRETGDVRMKEPFRRRIMDVLGFFRRHRNADGLFEMNDRERMGMIFFEWSDAAGFANGAHYPTNLLLAETLDAVARLYGMPALSGEAKAIREKVARLSWDGRWFRDHSVRTAGGGLELSRDISETCQYYAFLFGLATPESHPDLWRRLVEDFGRGRAPDGVAKSDLFTGILFRCMCLANAGRHDRVLETVRELDDMPRLTGTYWEKLPGDCGYSCAQGFMSWIADVLVKSALGISEIDYAKKLVSFAVPDNGLDCCRATLPTPDGPIRCEWKRAAGGITERLELPVGWKRK